MRGLPGPCSPAARLSPSTSTDASLLVSCCGSAEVNDISWSPDGRRLVTCSLSSEVFVWDIFANGGRGALAAKLAGHTGFVKGVAWDPLNRFIATEVASRIRLGTLESRVAVCRVCRVWSRLR